VREYAEYIATFVMWAATGRQYGLCEVTEQPCRKEPLEPGYETYPLDYTRDGPYLTGGSWYNGCVPDEPRCGCGPSSCCSVEISGPTTRTGMTVTLAGVALDSAAYRVVDGRTLMRVDGDHWPTCVSYESQDPPDFVVTHLVGTAVPDAVQHATNRLACEYAKHCAGGDCALPQQLRSLTRDGVEMQVVDLPQDSDMFRTGIASVDAVIQAVNPRQRPCPAVVYSPDLPRPRRVV
jgi:hypothetical protein